jgi:flagellar hook-basal body complex protein FliE
MIDAIAPLGALGDIEKPGLVLPPVAPAHDFAATLGSGLGAVNNDLIAADAATRALAAGEDIPVHQVMIALEEARVDMQMVVQVRNRLLSAYHDIATMQV